MMCVAKPVRILLACVLFCSTAPGAFAQTVDDDLRLDPALDSGLEEVAPPPPPSSRITIGDDAPEPVRRRAAVEDPYAAPGIGTGGLRLFPSLEIGSVVTSNVDQTETNKKSGIGLRVKPSLGIESDWSRHSLTANVDFSYEKLVKGGDARSIDAGFDGTLRLDVRRGTTADFDWSYELTSLDRNSNELPALAESERLDHEMAGGVRLTHDLGAADVSLRLGVVRNVYGNVKLTGGGEEDNKDRNFTELAASARGTLRTGGAVRPFAEIAYVPRFYDKKQDRNGIKRSSQGVRASAGVSFSDDAIWSGEVAAVLEHRDYSDSSLNSATAPGLVGNVTWRPTDLTRFEFNAGSSLAETVSAGVSASTQWNAGVVATHALRENLEVYAGGSLAFERSSASKDVTKIARLGVNWTINPFMVLNAGYEGEFYSTDVVGGDFTDHRLLTSIILRR